MKLLLPMAGVLNTATLAAQPVPLRSGLGAAPGSRPAFSRYPLCQCA